MKTYKIGGLRGEGQEGVSSRSVEKAEMASRCSSNAEMSSSESSTFLLRYVDYVGDFPTSVTSYWISGPFRNGPLSTVLSVLFFFRVSLFFVRSTHASSFVLCSLSRISSGSSSTTPYVPVRFHSCATLFSNCNLTIRRRPLTHLSHSVTPLSTITERIYWIDKCYFSFFSSSPSPNHDTAET